MILTEKELRTVTAVFDSVLHRNDLSQWLGSITERELHELYPKLHYREYCEKHGINFEDMTDDDFMRAYFEEQEG